MRYCMNCGSEIKTDGRFCPYCGTNLVPYGAEPAACTADRIDAVQEEEVLRIRGNAKAALTFGIMGLSFSALSILFAFYIRRLLSSLPDKTEDLITFCVTLSLCVLGVIFSSVSIGKVNAVRAADSMLRNGSVLNRNLATIAKRLAVFGLVIGIVLSVWVALFLGIDMLSEHFG